MFDIGFSELLLFGAIALIVLGPEKLPQAARTAGQWYAKFRRTVSTLQSEIEAELDLAETRKQMQAELEKIRQAEVDMKREMDALRNSVSELQQHGKVPDMIPTPQATADTVAISTQTITQTTPAIVSSNSPEISSLIVQNTQQDINDSEPASTLYTTRDHSVIDTMEIPDILPSSTSVNTMTATQLNTEDLEAEEVAKDLHDAIFSATEPMYYRWFLLSDYDRIRRLPNAPFLPNYKADPLLHQTSGVS